MADRRRQIAALEAKAASTTFPAEAEALRAKASELRAKTPAQEPFVTCCWKNWPTRASWEDHARSHPRPAQRPFASSNFPTYQPGDLFDAAGGVYVGGKRWEKGERVQVTVNHPGGSSYTIWVG